MLKLDTGCRVKAVQCFLHEIGVINSASWLHGHLATTTQHAVPTKLSGRAFQPNIAACSGCDKTQQS